MTKACGVLAGLASVILVCAAVWLGGLNQDEGWYLYAAQLVREGAMPYRDFFYTQGPLMPLLYAHAAPVWTAGGLLAARVLTVLLGLFGVFFAVGLVRQLVPADRRGAAGVAVWLLLACNLYHLYYLAIPKTYALASGFVLTGYFLLASALCKPKGWLRPFLLLLAGFLLALASGTRISLGLLLVVCGFGLLFSCRRFGLSFLWFGLGGAAGLVLVYGPFLLDERAFAGLCAAQKYHAARGGFSPVFVVGSVSRLIRWYLPLFILGGLACWSFFAPVAASVRPKLQPVPPTSDDAQPAGVGLTLNLMLTGFLAVFAVQMCAPFPYEDYQVPVIGLLAVVVVARLLGNAEVSATRSVYLALGLAFATAFGSPLLEKWMTNGQFCFWTMTKEKSELAQLRAAAREIERLDPGGKTLLTQDLYLAIETGRQVPAGLEMGPFSQLTDTEWRALLETTECPVAALSGYTFIIDPPVCTMRPLDQQTAYWDIVNRRYACRAVVNGFGQNATTLKILTRRDTP